MTLPSTNDVIEYVKAHPSCKSKEIASHFGCTTKQINRSRDRYPGIYKIPGITQQNFCHTYIDDDFPDLPQIPETKPAIAPKPQAKIKAKIKAKPVLAAEQEEPCCICQDGFDSPNSIVKLGCCSVRYHRECLEEMICSIQTCAGCRRPIVGAAARSAAPPAQSAAPPAARTIGIINYSGYGRDVLENLNTILHCCYPTCSGGGFSVRLKDIEKSPIVVCDISSRPANLPYHCQEKYKSGKKKGKNCTNQATQHVMVARGQENLSKRIVAVCGLHSRRDPHVYYIY